MNKIQLCRRRPTNVRINIAGYQENRCSVLRNEALQSLTDSRSLCGELVDVTRLLRLYIYIYIYMISTRRGHILFKAVSLGSASWILATTTSCASASYQLYEMFRKFIERSGFGHFSWITKYRLGPCRFLIPPPLVVTWEGRYTL